MGDFVQKGKQMIWVVIGMIVVGLAAWLLLRNPARADDEDDEDDIYPMW
jgi:hypothetical protein